MRRGARVRFRVSFTRSVCKGKESFREVCVYLSREGKGFLYIFLVKGGICGMQWSLRLMSLEIHWILLWKFFTSYKGLFDFIFLCFVNLVLQVHFSISLRDCYSPRY